MSSSFRGGLFVGFGYLFGLFPLRTSNLLHFQLFSHNLRIVDPPHRRFDDYQSLGHKFDGSWIDVFRKWLYNCRSRCEASTMAMQFGADLFHWCSVYWGPMAITYATGACWDTVARYPLLCVNVITALRVTWYLSLPLYTSHWRLHHLGAPAGSHSTTLASDLSKKKKTGGFTI